MSNPATAQRVNVPESAAQNAAVADLVAKLNEIVAAIAASPPVAAASSEIDVPVAPAPAADTPSAAAALPGPVATETPARYQAAPRALSRASYDSGEHYNTGLGHMTVSQLAERVGALPGHLMVATGSCLTAKMVRAYAPHHRSAVANWSGHRTPDGWCDVAVSMPHGVKRDGEFSTWFNAVALSGGPIEADRLARKLAKYAHDAPDAVVLVGGNPARLPDDVSSSLPPNTCVPIIESFPMTDIHRTALGPYGRGCGGIRDLDMIARTAKCMAGFLDTRKNLGRVASYVASAMAGKGLAALDLFYVPQANSRIAIESGCYACAHGRLLTLAEFQDACGGRTITERQIHRFYRPVMPSDPSVPYNPMARILAADVDNVADLYALLDDPLLRE
ncbi:hypothetical protein pneo_cds_842 [Pandoravirus neocaledonia]|uniref:DUF5865 domain-containing protein n=1 Tax=Pandoravirus neocaledonia TaxID=2107708 RepID=A0A2U7UDA3_9VIRU|nr:hypothetical protein pneo_cds_842 [Pandoravirus neocaledonia]AVK76449.1 hypothetical protein pneo_cds_842 [Pandoravirus neocaledonia]